VTLAPISLREAVAARKALNAQGKREVDTRAIIHTAIAQRELVERATLWRDDLDERAATIRMRKDCRGSTGLPCLIVAGKTYVFG